MGEKEKRGIVKSKLKFLMDSIEEVEREGRPKEPGKVLY